MHVHGFLQDTAAWFQLPMKEVYDIFEMLSFCTIVMCIAIQVKLYLSCNRWLGLYVHRGACAQSFDLNLQFRKNMPIHC